MTPHNSANRGDFAPTVLMPGDPLRAKFIAESFFENAVLVNNVRGIQGYTGLYHGKRVSVMASGMGMPSIGLYAHELFSFYDVENIIRIGTAGAISPTVPLRSVVFGMSASTDSNYAAQFSLPGQYAPTASFSLLRRAVEAAETMGIAYAAGNILSSDRYYDDASSTLDWQKMGTLAVEMESAALYMVAARLKKNALCICTVSNSLLTGEECSTEERQTCFTDMMKIALEIA